MKLVVKDMDIATGGILIATLNKGDAEKLDLHNEDRIRVRKGRRAAIAVVDTAESEKAVPVGQIGLFEESLDKLGARDRDIVDIELEKKPESLKLIKKKLEGRELSPSEILEIVKDIVNNELTAIETTYFISASYTHGLSERETIALTRAMIETGDVLKLDRHPVFDKHCIGGVAGNRTTMIIVPILAAAGLTIPKTSSRSITSPAGTADTMEVLAEVSLPLKKIKKIVEETNGCIAWGGAVNLAPADDKIIKVENPLSIDSEGNLLASILAKKGSVSSTHVLIDIPVGKGAKVQTRKEALHLKREFEKIGRGLGMRIKTVITDGSQPIGNGIGPLLEARDVLLVLMNSPSAPQDLRKKCIMLAEEMLAMAGKSRKLATEMLNSGKAYEKMVEIIKAQGEKCILPALLKPAKYKYNLMAQKSGRIVHIDNASISKIARIAGAPADKGAGIYLYRHRNERVAKGEKIFTVYAESRQKLGFAVDMMKEIDGVVIK
jgi:putative thymidine phosphorylase